MRLLSLAYPRRQVNPMKISSRPKLCFLRTTPLGSKLTPQNDALPCSHRFHHVPQAYKGRSLPPPSSNILHTHLVRRSSSHFVLQRQLLCFLSFSNSVITSAAFISTLSAICHAQRYPSQNTPTFTNISLHEHYHLSNSFIHADAFARVDFSS